MVRYAHTFIQKRKKSNINTFMKNFIYVLFMLFCILGRAGMVAIGGESDLSVDFRKLYDGVKQKLPSYARPYFVRIVSETDMTGRIIFCIQL